MAPVIISGPRLPLCHFATLREAYQFAHRYVRVVRERGMGEFGMRLQPFIIAEAEAIAHRTGQDVIAYRYRWPSGLVGHGVSNREDYEWWAGYFAIEASAVISPEGGKDDE